MTTPVAVIKDSTVVTSFSRGLQKPQQKEPFIKLVKKDLKKASNQIAQGFENSRKQAETKFEKDPLAAGLLLLLSPKSLFQSKTLTK